MKDELARIRERVAQRRTALARIDELSLQQDLRDWTRGEKAEYQNLNRELNFSAWGR